MAEEKLAPLPLTGEEVQEAVLAKIEESFNRTCHLKYDNAYTEFRAKIKIELELFDYGRKVEDNHEVKIEGMSGILAQAAARVVEANITMEPVPPNQARVESGQPVPVVVVENGKRVVKHLKYAARKGDSPKLDKKVANERRPDTV